MARTTAMRLVELMILKQDISKVLSLLGRQGNFQFQNSLEEEKADKDKVNHEYEIYKELDQVRSYFCLDEFNDDIANYDMPSEQDYEDAEKILASVKEIQTNDTEEYERNKKVTEAYEEAKAFANLKASYSDLEHLSFLSLRVGRIDPAEFDDLKFNAGSRAIIVPLGNDKSHILAATSKKGRFALDTELKKHNFVNLEIPQDFKGIPDDVLETLKHQKEQSDELLNNLDTVKKNYCATHSKELYRLMGNFSVGSQVRNTENKLESTKLVYRITGWIPAVEADRIISELENITEKRIAVRKYEPEEVPSVINGKEKVPVELKHGKFVSSFKRMVFSYGSPVYGSIDPTPFVALFFTILFGIMFGDAGQGLVFLLMGILMGLKVIKVGNWNKFAPIFIAIGCTSMIMGILTGEFFANETLLIPVARFFTGLFGEPRDHILHMMPNSNPESILNMFKFFGFSVAVGFVINSTGVILNIFNNILRKRIGKALFGKNGLCGAVFFWGVVILVLRVLLLKHSVSKVDVIIIASALFGAAFGEPFERLLDGERPVFENGFGAAFIGGIVELIEVVIGYLSNTVSLLRVGAFALAHAVLGYIISKMCEIAPGPASLVILIIGNGIVVVLEGMIVAIQVIRLQYYEFFSKFFNETGREFTPYVFTSVPVIK